MYMMNRPKGEVQQSVLGGEGEAEAGPSTGENVDEDEVDEGELISDKLTSLVHT